MSFGFNICISLKQTVLYKQMDQQIRMARNPSPMKQQKKMETSSDETWTRIINFVRKYQSSQLREKQIEQRFTLNHQKLMDIRLKNNEFIIHLYINIQKIWSLGLLKIRDKVRELNNQKKYSFILGFDLSKKQIFIKVVGEKAFINKEILQLLKKNAQQIEEEFFSMGSNLENGDLKSFPILVQYEKWSRQNNTKRCYILGFQKFKIEKTLIKPDEIAEEMKFFSKVFEGLGKNLKQKWKKSSNILQAIRLNQELRTERISGGCNGIVEKLQAVYKISPNFSIHAQTNQQLKKEEQKQNMNMLKQQKQQKSYLIRKTYIQDKFNYFESEINLLKIIRAQKCESINSFYCKPSSLDNLKSPNVFLYSQYHNRTISRQCGIKNCFTIMRTLCEGLVFLSWHGISHRDLKPDNILASKKNVAKIIDFGSACLNSQRKMGQPRLTDSSSVLSTNAKYNLRFSDLPRQLRNQIQIEPFESHCRFDIYAFGKILQNLLLGSDNEKELGNQLWECFWYLSSLCQQYDPNDRPTPIQIYAFLKIILKSQCPKKSEEP